MTTRLLLACLLLTSSVSAGPFRQVSEDPYERAGNPHHISPLAQPTYTKHYRCGYVGGSAPLLGEYRTTEEGTWGRDYSGIVFPRRTWLGWLHGRLHQNGGGVYKSDGPKLR